MAGENGPARQAQLAVGGGYLITGRLLHFHVMYLVLPDNDDPFGVSAQEKDAILFIVPCVGQEPIGRYGFADGWKACEDALNEALDNPDS